jgi:hypothetical protein
VTITIVAIIYQPLIFRFVVHVGSTVVEQSKGARLLLLLLPPPDPTIRGEKKTSGAAVRASLRRPKTYVSPCCEGERMPARWRAA